jgi:dCMP deaminase
VSREALRLANNTTKHKAHFYMQLAMTAALNSNDPKTQVGCVLVDKDRHIISVGYNAFPYSFEDRDDETTMTEWKDLAIIHAEANAIHHCKEPARLKDAVVYVTLHPCSVCAKMLIHAQVSLVIYWSYRRSDKEKPMRLDEQREKLKAEQDKMSQMKDASSSARVADIEREIADLTEQLKKEDDYFCAQEMLRKARIPVVPFCGLRDYYEPTQHKRLDNIVRTMRKQVYLYWSLKEREQKTPNTKWPSTMPDPGSSPSPAPRTQRPRLLDTTPSRRMLNSPRREKRRAADRFEEENPKRTRSAEGHEERTKDSSECDLQMAAQRALPQR